MSHKHLSMFCFVILFLTACGTAAPTPQVMVTSEVTITLIPTVTPTFIPTVTVTPAPAFSPEVDGIIADETTPEEVGAFLTVAKEGGLAAEVENDKVKIEGDIYIDQTTGKTERTYQFTLPDGRVIPLTARGQVGVDVMIDVDKNGNTVVTTEAWEYTKEAGWKQARALAPDGITETEFPKYSKMEAMVMWLAETLKIENPNWQDANSPERAESRDRARMALGLGDDSKVVSYEDMQYDAKELFEYDSRLYIVDQNGNKVIEIPTVFSAWKPTDKGEQTVVVFGDKKIITDGNMKSSKIYAKLGVTYFSMTQEEYDAIMSALTPTN